MRFLTVAACVFSLAGAAALAGAQTGQDGARFLVIPFENPAHDAKISWIGEAAAILLSDDLNAAGLHAYTREERLGTFEQLQVPLLASLSHATVIRLGRLLGATHVVIGSVSLNGAQLSIRAQNIRLDTGRLESEVAESGALEDLLGVFDRIASRIASPPQGRLITSRRVPLQVFENYVKGLMASTAANKIAFLQSALKLDPTFDLARLALWSVNEDKGNSQAALIAATAVPEGSPLYSRARFSAALSLVHLRRLDEAFATFKTMVDRAPTAALMNNLGVIQMRRGATPQAGKATFYFNQAVKLDPGDPDYYFNLGFAYWIERDNQGAIYWLREAVRRRPADSEAHAVLSAALQAVGAGAESSRERDLAVQLSSRLAELLGRTTSGDVGLRGLERLKTALEVSPLRRVEMAIAESGQRDQRELAAFHLERGRRFYDQGNDGEAMVELRRALYLSPYEAEAHLVLGRIYLRTGPPQAAIDALKIALWSSESPDAHLALAQAYAQAKNKAAARSEAERALAMSPASVEARNFLDSLKP
jgi:tetratricopeptide (TPR) repeat protein